VLEALDFASARGHNRAHVIMNRELSTQTAILALI